MLDTESFGSTFGPKSQRKKPRLAATDVKVCKRTAFLCSMFIKGPVHLPPPPPPPPKSLAKSVGESSSKYQPDCDVHVTDYQICLDSYVPDKDKDIVREGPEFR